MNANTKRKRSIVSIILGTLFIVLGFLCMDRLAGHYLGYRRTGENGIVLFYVNNAYQWCSWLTVVGAFMVCVGLTKISDVLSAWSFSVYERYTTLKRCKMVIWAFFFVCINAFTLDYFAGLTELEYRDIGLEEELVRFEKYNLYMAFGFGMLLLIIMFINSCTNGKLKLIYYVVSIAAIFESVLGIVVRTSSVKWLWVVYAAGAIICGLWLATKITRVRPGIGYGKKPERVAENIAFFASSHGLGHIMRLTPVIEYILKTSDCKIVLVCDDEKLEFAKGYLYTQTGIPEDYLDSHLETVAMNTDFGIKVKDGSLKIDALAVQEGVVNYISKIPSNAYNAVEMIDDYEITKVVSDITPFAFASASFRRIPSILMLSFTWIEIYQEYLNESLISPYREMFGRANKVLRYALCNRVSRLSFPEATDVGFVARPINYAHAEEIKNSYDKPIIYFSIGLSNSGIDISPDVSDLPYTFIVTRGVKLVGDNVVMLEDKQYDTQDYVAASKYCIIKSGWTTISECMIAGKPMALLGRDDVAEDRMSIEMLVEMNRGIKIDVEQIADLESVIKDLEANEFDTTPMNNDFAHIAEEILNYH